MSCRLLNLRVFSLRVVPLCASALLIYVPAASPAQVSGSSSGVATNNVYPIDLPTALRLANAQNLDIQIARERLKEAKANHESAVELFLPWVAPGAVYRRHENRIQDVVGNILDADKQSYTVGGALTAQMDLGDAVYKSLAAKQLVNAADHALESQRQDSTLAAAQGYYDLAKAKAIVEVVKEALSISQDYQKQLHDAVGAGIAFKGDELRVQTQTERYQTALRQALEQQRVAAARLAQILHLDSAVELVPQDTDLVPLTLVETNAPLDSLVQQALRSRPELKQSQALVSAAHYFVGLGWRIGPGGLFDFSRVRASKARLETARLSGAKVQDEITRQVVESHARAQSLLDQITTTKQNLATASETLRLTRERKQFGVGAVLEDIQAQQELTRARSDYLNAVAEFNKAQYGLAKAVGELSETGKTDNNTRTSIPRE